MSRTLLPVGVGLHAVTIVSNLKQYVTGQDSFTRAEVP